MEPDGSQKNPINKQTFPIGIAMNSDCEANLTMAPVLLISVPDVVTVVVILVSTVWEVITEGKLEISCKNC
jgi:hypothetical protein